MEKLLYLSLFVFVFAVGQATTLAQVVAKNTNERLVIDFCNLAFNARKPAEAAQRYIGPIYSAQPACSERSGTVRPALC